MLEQYEIFYFKCLYCGVMINSHSGHQCVNNTPQAAPQAAPQPAAVSQPDGYAPAQGITPNPERTASNLPRTATGYSMSIEGKLPDKWPGGAALGGCTLPGPAT